MNPTKPVAWTGGCRPAKPSEQNKRQATLRSQLFRQQVEVFYEYWGDCPSWDTIRIYFRRANYDAHATFRT